MTQKKCRVIYQLMTDRLARLSERMLARVAASIVPSFIEEWADEIAAGWMYPVQRENPVGWHGGNYPGLALKTHEGYFKDLSNALLISGPCLQVKERTGALTGLKEVPYHGYHPEDLLLPNKRFGSVSALRKLSREANSKGMELLMDAVHHLGSPEAELYRERPDLFLPKNEWSWSELPLFDMTNFEARRYVWQSFRYWRERGVQGFRWDTAGHLSLDYLSDLVNSPLSPVQGTYSFGEVFDGDIAALVPFLNVGMNALDYPLHFKILDCLAVPGGHGPLNELAAHMRRYQELGVDQSNLVRFLDNPDTSRFVWEVLKRHFADPNSEVGSDPTDPYYARQRLDLGLSYLYSLEGDILIYYGTECGVAGEGMRSPFGENRLSMDFSLSQRLKPRLQALYRARMGNSALVSGDYRELWQPQWGGAAVLCHARVNTQQAVVVVLNNGSLPAEVNIPVHGLLGEIISELTGRSHNMRVNGNLVGTVPARTLYMFTSK